MKRVWFAVLAAVVVLNLAAFFAGGEAEARPKYNTAFRKAYVKKDTPIYAAIKGKSLCNTCHVGGEKEREMLNDFGDAMAENLPDADVKEKEIIEKALQKTVAQPSGEKGSATWEELIKTGKLPITEKKAE